ncbi:hypothetical protein BGX29_001291 [Mortierella sp. GBA35]|nr:hypothetical protein BGX29_001291 [Mortierella sp. GBA35]
MTPRTTPVLFTFPFPSYDEHFPSTVQVTGTFDDWQRATMLLTKNEQEGRFEAEILVDLEKSPGVYQEVVQEHDNNSNGATMDGCGDGDDNGGELPAGARLRRKLIYKFVLDGHHWVTDAGQSLERDHEGNLNNIRFLENVTVDERRQQQQSTAQDAEVEVEEALKSLEVKEVQAMARDDSISASAAGATTTLATTDATIAVSVDETANEIKSRPVSTSMISIDADDAVREHDGDYGVAILQGAPVTVSTTSMPNLHETHHRLSTIEGSMRMTMESVDTITPSNSSSTISSCSTSTVHPINVTMHNEDTTKEFVVQASAPTTAVSTSVPQLPSTSTLATSTKKKTSGFLKKIKKVLA